MTKEDRDRAEARFNKSARASNDAKTGKSDRDASAKAVLDNMAKLKALRLAREAAAPPVVAPAKKAAKSAGKTGMSAAGDKTPALSDWLAGQQNGGRRT